MQEPFAFEFPSIAADAATIYYLRPEDCKYKIQYAQAKLASTPGINVLRQFFSGHAFYLELISYDIKEAITLKLKAKKPYLSFVFVMEGEVSFLQPGDPETIVISQGQYFAHYVPAGEYLWPVVPAKKEVVCFILRPKWLQKMSDDYPELMAVIKKLMIGHTKQQVFERCRMTYNTKRQLEKLRDCKFKKKVDLEEALLHAINKLVTEYHVHLKSPNKIPQKTNKEIAYLVRDYIAAEIEKGLIPNVTVIADHFNTEQKSLRRTCLKTFKLNLQDLITVMQMEKAHALLKNAGLRVKEVADALGYSEAVTFTRKFKKHYGYPPSKIQKK